MIVEQGGAVANERLGLRPRRHVKKYQRLAQMMVVAEPLIAPGERLIGRRQLLRRKSESDWVLLVKR